MQLDLRPIKTDEDYRWALAEVEPYFLAEPAEDSPDAARFDILTTLIEAYEAEHHAIPALDPVEIIEAHMLASGRTQGDLAILLGSKSRASEILRRRRGLTVDMVHRLHTEWGIPAENLVRPYHLNAVA